MGSFFRGSTISDFKHCWNAHCGYPKLAVFKSYCSRSSCPSKINLQPTPDQLPPSKTPALYTPAAAERLQAQPLPRAEEHCGVAQGDGNLLEALGTRLGGTWDLITPHWHKLQGFVQTRNWTDSPVMENEACQLTWVPDNEQLNRFCAPLENVLGTEKQNQKAKARAHWWGPHTSS